LVTKKYIFDFKDFFMHLLFHRWLLVLLGSMALVSCGKKIKEQQDTVYSRHLQRQVQLSIFSTPLPADKSQLNLLILNDGQDAAALQVRETLNQLLKDDKINPLVVVAVHAGDRNREYGVAGKPDYQQRGDRADHYADFIARELYPFIKKRAGVRSFQSVAIAGCSLGGLSAFDIAWNHADKIDIAGVLSGSFWWRDKDLTDSSYNNEANRILLASLRTSRKKPKLTYWFYAGAAEETADRDKDGITDVVDDTRDVVEIIRQKKICPPQDIVYTESAAGKHDYESWSRAFPDFLLWAFGKK